MDGRKSRYIEEEWYRGEDAGDLKRSELNLLVEMDEELVQNGVVGGQFVKNFVMDAKIDPKVVMDLPILKNWWMGQFATH